MAQGERSVDELAVKKEIVAYFLIPYCEPACATVNELRKRAGCQMNGRWFSVSMYSGIPLKNLDNHVTAILLHMAEMTR
jgi:hypothetical protein